MGLLQVLEGPVDGGLGDLREFGPEDPDVGPDRLTDVDDFVADVLPLSVAIRPDDQPGRPLGLALKRFLEERGRGFKPRQLQL